MKKLSIFFLTVIVLAGCGESLEDTYKDYAGDGKIRYLGKCSNIKCTQGWKRLTAVWQNAIDPVIANVKISWESDGVKRDSLLPKETTVCDIKNLEDGNYEITVCSVDRNGNESLPIYAYGRPYSLNHEIVQTFSRVVSKNFFTGNRLIVFFDKWNANFHAIRMKYTTSDGTPKTLPLTKELVDLKYYLLEDEIDPSKPVTIEREGYIEGSEDLIIFDPFDLNPEYSFTADFKHILKARYGQSVITREFVENLEELEIDYSINSLDDILYFPKLKKLHLGKNRFQLDDYVIVGEKFYYGNASTLKDNIDRTQWMLDMAHQLNGLVIERYNEHFIPFSEVAKFPYLTEKGNPAAPSQTFIDPDTFDYTCSVEDFNYDSHLEYLFDGDYRTAWLPVQSSIFRTYEISIDLKEIKTVNGIQIVQRTFDPQSDGNYLKLLPQMISIVVSKDRVYWSDATYVAENTLGNTVGEITEIIYQNTENIRYIKVIVNDMPVASSFGVTLAEMRIF